MNSTMQVSPFVDGEELGSSGGGMRDVVNPATGDVVARQSCCDSACVDRIVQSSARAFESSAWQSLGPAARGAILLRLADLVEKRSEELVQLELQDVGKPIAQLRGGEIPLTAAIIRFYAGAADKIEGAVKSVEGGHFYLTMFEPYGVVAGILPWNYPLVNAALKVAPALAAGNAIVLKPSVETPLSTVAFARLALEAGAPRGIVNVALGSGSQAGNALVSHPAVRKISFTGSTEVGQHIQKLAAEQMKAVNLECGGKNAILVFDDADLDRAANAAIISAFVNCGQLCVSCSRLLVQESIHDEFLSLLKSKVEKLKVGDPCDEQTLVGPMITQAQYDIALSYLKDAPCEGGRVFCGGGKLAMPGRLAGGFWLEPTILSGVRVGMKVHDEEIFGPVLSVLSFQDEAEAVRIGNAVPYGLSGSVWTANGSRALRLVRALDTGIIWVNTMLTGYPQIPVPPHKMSGTGVELGMEGLLAFCRRKSAMLGYDDQMPVGWGL
jgi:acyl-CoA reductase-like NAD-dependent aldehyde dehydrogenase